MGKKGKLIVSLDLEELVNELNKALADEWLAYYQYWLASIIACGRNAAGANALFKRIAAEELEHASELGKRIVQLGGLPLTNPKQWQAKANCSYVEPPENPSQVEDMIKDAADSEVCAIEVYQKLAKKTAQKDFVTHQLITHILAEEVEHEDTFENLLL